jgi:hypothetical protein
MALFTNYDISKHRIYDRDLFESINISNPVDLSKIDNIDIEEVERLVNEIGFFKIQRVYSRASRILEEQKREFNDILIKDKKYYSTELGKIHLYHIYIVLSNLLGECMKEEVKGNEH